MLMIATGHLRNHMKNMINNELWNEIHGPSHGNVHNEKNVMQTNVTAMEEKKSSFASSSHAFCYYTCFLLRR